jgi:L-iditol 2-dehydrogenase
MLAIQLNGIGTLSPAEIEKPVGIGRDEVLIKIKSIGVCGSDVHYFREGKIGSQVVEYPFLLGHECSGIIEQCGAEVTHVIPGDLVVIDPSVHCGECDQCLSGRPHTCRNNRFLGCPGQLEGCLTEYLVMPGFTCFRVTGKLDAVEAALVEPFSIGVYSVRKAGISGQSESCAIFGAGPIGLSILLKLHADGIQNVGIIEPLDYRLEKAKDMDAAWTLNPDQVDIFREVKSREELLLDVVFDASGEQEAVNNALRILKPGGKLVLVGIPPDARYTFDMDLMRRKELTVINVRRQNHCVEEAIGLIAGGMVNVKEMVTHQFPLAEAPAAFEMVAGYHDHVIKAMINI